GGVEILFSPVESALLCSGTVDARRVDVERPQRRGVEILGLEQGTRARSAMRRESRKASQSRGREGESPRCAQERDRDQAKPEDARVKPEVLRGAASPRPTKYEAPETRRTVG